MIIQSRTVLAKPELGVFSHLGEYSEGYVYKTSDLSSVKAANPDSEVTEVPSENLPTLRKVLFTAAELDRKTQEKIRARYTLEAELGAIRTNNLEYKNFIEQVVAEHNAAKDALFSV